MTSMLGRIFDRHIDVILQVHAQPAAVGVTLKGAWAYGRDPLHAKDTAAQRWPCRSSCHSVRLGLRPRRAAEARAGSQPDPLAWYAASKPD